MVLTKRNKTTPENCSNLSWCIGFILTLSMMYFLLLGSAHTIFSLSYLLDLITQLPAHEQLLAMSMIPIYLSILIFGGGVIGGIMLSRLCAYLKQKLTINR